MIYLAEGIYTPNQSPFVFSSETHQKTTEQREVYFIVCADNEEFVKDILMGVSVTNMSKIFESDGAMVTGDFLEYNDKSVALTIIEDLRRARENR